MHRQHLSAFCCSTARRKSPLRRIQSAYLTEDIQVPNASIFTINKEDHTLGNMIRAQLLKDPLVTFAGYKNPHPLEHKILLRVQTTPDSTPVEALKSAINDLMSELSLFEERFQEAYKEKCDNMD
ncbi:DNA-directed RNA polymerase II subunit RPB11-like isoform X1 [Varroa jacobsoni]|uniref:DNA-directed RNA polymerase RBP11-like dimerisation domain-containing protein n=1 Tax=Varroa destructor TaxID=109461 RepID=A0A7M7IWH4_VARDE|nr:DNA-directed RNA polymerase II subunit RPB11-like isoform X2 [Varroa destructor]XP_022685951.1 DNA-directed RNA polymerase II subunit RPB11-like isoform X1 [Varroa jacobsoni]